MKSRWISVIAALVGAAAAAQTPRLGPVSHLPLPRFVSLNAEKGNARRGPGRSYRIDWVFHHRGQPLEVVEEWGQWLMVRDQEGASGWMHNSLLRGTRMAVVIAAEGADLRDAPSSDGSLTARAELGALGRLDACAPEFCLFQKAGVEGWIAKSAIWGARAEEVFD